MPSIERILLIARNTATFLRDMNKKLALAIISLLILAAAGFGIYFYLGSPTKGPTPVPPPSSGKPSNPPLAKANMPEAESVSTTASQTLYHIVSAESSATFTLDEMLRGEPKTVVGTSTGFIAGEIGLDKNLASSTIGLIKINARTFSTDDNMRNNAIRRMILKTENDANEFITFKPTSIVEAVVEGQDVLPGAIYDITGDLTIAGITKPVTFRVDTLLETDLLSGRAYTTINRSDFNLVIPNIPFVANVEETVDLEIYFVAKP